MTVHSNKVEVNVVQFAMELIIKAINISFILQSIRNEVVLYFGS